MMMNLLLSIVFLLISGSHDIQVAFFKIHGSENLLVLDLIFEKEDLFDTLRKDDSELLTDDVRLYLDEHFSIKINGEPCSFDFGEINIETKHVHLSGSLNKKIESITSIEIDNTCLENISNHSNIIELKLHDTERDFLMNKNRTNIKITY